MEAEAYALVASSILDMSVSKDHRNMDQAFW